MDLARVAVVADHHDHWQRLLRQDRPIQLGVLTAVLVLGGAVAPTGHRIAQHDAGFGRQVADVRSAVPGHPRPNREVLDCVGDGRRIDCPQRVQLLGLQRVSHRQASILDVYKVGRQALPSARASSRARIQPEHALDNAFELVWHLRLATGRPETRAILVLKLE